jgi:quercetin dioxygenase-like cupin family protein
VYVKPVLLDPAVESVWFLQAQSEYSICRRLAMWVIVENDNRLRPLTDNDSWRGCQNLKRIMHVSANRNKVEHAPGLFSVKLIDGSSGAAGLSLLRGWLKPGAQHALHTHDTEEVVYVLSGEGIVEIAGRFYPARAGDAFRFGANVPHATLNTHPAEDLVFVAAFADQIVGAKSCSARLQARPEGRLTPLFNRARWLVRKLARKSLYRLGKN